MEMTEILTGPRKLRRYNAPVSAGHSGAITVRFGTDSVLLLLSFLITA